MADAGLSPCSLDIMEEELTCPVCLELYCNPAILPCSHSMCRGCISNILNSKLSISRANSAHAGASFQCPSCRETTDLTLDKVPLLPRNLALENIVRRYLEEKRRSTQMSVLVDPSVHKRGVCLRNKVRRSMSARSPRPQSASVLEYFSNSSNTATVSCNHTCLKAGDQPATTTAAETALSECDLCDNSGTGKQSNERGAGRQPMSSAMVWYCEHCRVSYCTSCLHKYHPRRGMLALHNIRSSLELHSPHRGSKERESCYSDSSSLSRHTTPAISGGGEEWEVGGVLSEGMVQCVDHSSETSTMFCDRCKVYVCHLCVCDGEGRHAGHKMLTPDTACSIIKALSCKTKEQADQLLAELLSDRSKIDGYCQQINELYDVARARVDLQCARLMSDLSTALLQEKQQIVDRLEDTRRRVCRQVSLRQQEAERCSQQLSELSRSCQAVSAAESNVEVLSQASLVQPLSVKVKRSRKEVGLLHRKYEVITRDKSSKLQLLASTEQLRKRINKLLSWFIDDGNSGSDSIIPHILTMPLSTTAQLNRSSSNSHLPQQPLLGQPPQHSLSEQQPNQQPLPGRQQKPLPGQQLMQQLLPGQQQSQKPFLESAQQPLPQKDLAETSQQQQQVQLPLSQQSLSQQPLSGRSDPQAARRVLNKCLTTWGFSSTSFTGEAITNNCSWSVTIEKNTASGATETSGYLFGVGISTEVLGSRDSVGMTSKSYGVVVRGGMFAFANAGKCENLFMLNGSSSECRNDGSIAFNNRAAKGHAVCDVNSAFNSQSATSRANGASFNSGLACNSQTSNKAIINRSTACNSRGVMGHGADFNGSINNQAGVASNGSTAFNIQSAMDPCSINNSSAAFISDSTALCLSDISSSVITSSSLPLCLTVGVRTEAPDITVLTYRLGSGPGDGAQKACLVGRRIIRDPVLIESIYPVFTVSRGVRIIFPTYV